MTLHQSPQTSHEALSAPSAVNRIVTTGNRNGAQALTGDRCAFSAINTNDVNRPFSPLLLYQVSRTHLWSVSNSSYGQTTPGPSRVRGRHLQPSFATLPVAAHNDENNPFLAVSLFSLLVPPRLSTDSHMLFLEVGRQRRHAREQLANTAFTTASPSSTAAGASRVRLRY